MSGELIHRKVIPNFNAYGTITHLPGSKHSNVKDKASQLNLAKIATDTGKLGGGRPARIIVQQKMDGSCVGILKQNGMLIPINRAGYRCSVSHWLQHKVFANWVFENFSLWWDLLDDNELIVGEWLAQVHSTRYGGTTGHDLFWAFDLFKVDGTKKTPYLYEDCVRRFKLGTEDQVINWAPLVVNTYGMGVSIRYAMSCLGTYGLAGIAADPVEGAVWRVEDMLRNKVSFLCKYVKKDFVPGKWLHLDVFNPPYQKYGRSQIIFV